MVQANTGDNIIETPHINEFQRMRRVFFGRFVVAFGMGVILLLIITAIFAPWLAPHDPYQQNLDQTLLQPSMAHPLGTDSLGRDTLSRIIYGSRNSLMVGVIALGIAASIGMTMGMVSGYFGGWIDTLFMRFIDALMCFPMILLAGVSWVLVFPTNLISVIGGLALPKLGRSTIDEPARKSFQAMVPPERRGRVSMFMDSYLFAIGAIVGSLIIGTVILLEDQLGSIDQYYIYLGVAAAATVVTIWFAFRMRGVYDASLLNWRLKRRQRASGVLDKLDF